jgi:hypothetical protein
VRVAITREQSFLKYVEERYKGKVHRMERLHRPDFIGVDVYVMFRIPDVDEIEMYRRIIRVLEVIAEGEE